MSTHVYTFLQNFSLVFGFWTAPGSWDQLFKLLNLDDLYYMLVLISLDDDHRQASRMPHETLSLWSS